MSIAQDKVNSFDFEDSIKNAGFATTQIRTEADKNLYFNVRISDTTSE